MIEGKQVLLVNGAHGVYVPKVFAESEVLVHEWNLPQEAVDILRAGPDHQYYWVVWVEVLDGAMLHGDSHTWTLYQSPEGDLFAVRDDWEGPGCD
jgi:hypothetical protein